MDGTKDDAKWKFRNDNHHFTLVLPYRAELIKVDPRESARTSTLLRLTDFKCLLTGPRLLTVVALRASMYADTNKFTEMN